ncbi:50S ribosomal protein L25 [Patescibacteria group bacterium AH-259-L05]|nr:50S ribosomal protein L25 [Patescibacteria group bacterium AH-259-L05]
METLSAQERKIKGRKTNFLRNKKIIPAVVYGHGFDSLPIEISYTDFIKVYKAAGESSLITLEIKNKQPVKSLIYKLQYHPLTDKIIHVDFYKIKAGEKITVEVELTFRGVSSAVKDLGGTLVTPLSKVEIECLPEDLIGEIEVDISGLKEFGDAIRVRDLNVPSKVKILQDLKEVVTIVEQPQIEEREKPEEEVSKEAEEGKQAEEKSEEGRKEEKKSEGASEVK